MSDRFVPAARMAGARLNANVPMGLFSPRPSGSVSLMVIGDVEGAGRQAVALVTGNPKLAFMALTCDDQSANWSGIHHGPVEVLVDPASGVFQDHDLPFVGAVAVTRGRVLLGARSPEVHGVVGVHISAAETNFASTAVFERWQLVQRRWDGTPDVIFERGDDPIE